MTLREFMDKHCITGYRRLGERDTTYFLNMSSFVTITPEDLRDSVAGIHRLLVNRLDEGYLQLEELAQQARSNLERVEIPD